MSVTSASRQTCTVSSTSLGKGKWSDATHPNQQVTSVQCARPVYSGFGAVGKREREITML